MTGIASSVGIQYWPGPDIAPFADQAKTFGLQRIKFNMADWAGNPSGTRAAIAGYAAAAADANSYLLAILGDIEDTGPAAGDLGAYTTAFTAYCRDMASAVLGCRNVIFEIWNEPNIHPPFAQDYIPGQQFGTGAANYASFCNAAADAIRSVSDVQICTGGISMPFTPGGQGPGNWSRGAMAGIHWDKVSFFGFHTYGSSGDVRPEFLGGEALDDIILYMRQTLDGYAGSNAADVLMTEKAWANNEGSDLDRAAYYAREALVLARCRVETGVWFLAPTHLMPALGYDIAAQLKMDFAGNAKEIPHRAPPSVVYLTDNGAGYQWAIAEYSDVVVAAVWKAITGSGGAELCHVWAYGGGYSSGQYLDLSNPSAGPQPLYWNRPDEPGRFTNVSGGVGNLMVSGMPTIFYLYKSAPQSPVLSVNPYGILDIGEVAVGQSIETDLTTVSNIGGGVLVGTVSADPPFSVVSGASFTLRGGQSQPVRVRFAPTAAGSYSSPMPYETNAGHSTGQVTGLAVTPGTRALSLTGVGSGTITVDGTAVALPWSGEFPSGAQVSLAAVPDPGWRFDGWSGDLSGDSSPATVTMDSNKSITAAFSELPYDHVVSVIAAADPQVVASGGGTYLSATASDQAGHQVASWNWSDQGAGGAFYPDATAQSPVWVAPGNYTGSAVERVLVVTASCDGSPAATGSATATVSESPDQGTGIVEPLWRALLLVYRNIDADYTDSSGTPRHLTMTMPDDELLMGQSMFRQFPALADDYSGHEALIDYDMVFIDRPIATLTSMGTNLYWPSPTDTRTELDALAPPGAYDSILVYWPQTDHSTGDGIPSGGWGLAIGAGPWSNDATYATVANAPVSTWADPTSAQVWLHEWLHGVCDYYESCGYVMPAGNADGGESHGYSWSPTDGWGAYYRDLMTGHVLEGDTYTGITPEAWQRGSILGTRVRSLVDYFYTDTTASYDRTGTVNWDSTYRIVDLGTATAADNKLYTPIDLDRSLVLTGRAFIPGGGVGSYDSVALAVCDATTEYWATLAYGTELTQRDHISIMENDSWGGLYPLTLAPGWYTISLLLDYEADAIRMKAWRDGTNEPDWQVSRSLAPGWTATAVGFRHYGQGTSVDDLFAVETSLPGRYALSVTGTGSGSVRVGGVDYVLPWAGEFDEGDQVVIEAVPDAGWQFSSWTGSVTDSRNPLIVTVDSAKDIVAGFVTGVTLSVTGSHGQARIEGLPHALPWSGSFPPGTSVSLEALPDEHFRFVEWLGDVVDTNPSISILMDESKSVTAHIVLDFMDVPEDHWAYAEIASCVEADIVAGYPGGNYYPEYAVTRDQMAAYISRALAGGDDSVPAGPATATFDDVPTDHWAFRYVEYCHTHDVVEGYSRTTYAPDAVVDRGQMAVYTARAVAGGDGAVPPDTDGATFADVSDVNDWAWCYNYVEYCASEGIVRGYWDGTYHPEREVTRDQMAVYAARAFGLE